MEDGKQKPAKPKGSKGKPQKEKTPKPWEFQKGNNAWERRTKVGRDTLFASPEELWKEAEVYFKWIDSNPLYKAEWKGKMVHIPVRKPYTLTGLCLYLDIGEEYFAKFKGTPPCTDAFMKVIERIEKTIRDQKFEGAASGFFNANIIARDLGLRDASDITTKGKEISTSPQINLPNITSEDLREILKGADSSSDQA